MTGGARHPGEPGRDPVLAVHVAFLVTLGIASVVLLTAPAAGSDLFPIAVLGVLAIGELLAVLVAIAFAGATGRHSPLAAIDAMVTAPVLGVAPSSLFGDSPSSGAIPLIVVALLVAGLASTVVATRIVREHDLERWLLGAVLLLTGAFWLAVPVAIVVPLVALIALFGPRLDGLAARSAAGTGPAHSRTTRAAPRRPTPTLSGPPRPAGRGRAPDAAAVLAGRRAGPGRPGPEDGAPPPEDRLT